jgi:hypothetical protein
MSTATASTSEETQAAWDHLAECLRTLNALGTGAMHWSERFAEEDLPLGLPLQEAAIEVAAGEADEARRALLARGVDVPDEVGS